MSQRRDIDTQDSPLDVFINQPRDAHPFLPPQIDLHVPLPNHAQGHYQPEYRGSSPQSITTSRMVTRNRFPHGSLPGLGNSFTSLPSNSTNLSHGEREITRRTRILVFGADGVLLANDRLLSFEDPNKNHRPVLESPFKTIGCILDFAKLEDWFWHSLEHFHISRPYTHGHAIVMPPTDNRCCFCPREFFSFSGMESWIQRMGHIAYHHRAGHSLSHARPDFPLYDYLWENHLIDEIDYREIKGNTRDASQMTRGNPSPPTSDTSGSPPTTPPAEASRPVTVLHDPKREGRRSRR